jgi:RNA polymerase sigma-70 factor (ECF subfamily)
MQLSINNFGSEKEGAIATHPQLATKLCDWLNLVASHKDKKAFTQLFNFFAPKIKRFGLSKLNTDAMANELVQDTMTLVWKKAHLYQFDKGAATTCVYTLMRNTCFDMLRKLKHKESVSLSDDIWPMEVEEALTDKTEFKDHLLNEDVLRCIDNLPLAQQSIIKGVYYQELTQEQIANQLGIPLGTVKSRLRLALSKLKQQMGDKYHD